MVANKGLWMGSPDDAIQSMGNSISLENRG